LARPHPATGDNNWWTAKLYAFPDSGRIARVVYTPADARQQPCHAEVSHDGSRVAFIAGIMSDFGSTGGDIYTLSLEGGSATNLTKDSHASATQSRGAATAICRRTSRRRQDSICDLGSGIRRRLRAFLWSGPKIILVVRGISTACPSGVTADAHESFTQAP